MTWSLFNVGIYKCYNVVSRIGGTNLNEQKIKIIGTLANKNKDSDELNLDNC